MFDEMKRRVRLSLDLVPDDGESIIAWIEGQLKRALPSAMLATGQWVEMEPLESLPLYNR